MIEIPEGKFVGEPALDRDAAETLSQFLSDPRNKPLKKAFEKAAGIEFHGRSNGLFFADKREGVEPAKAAIQKLTQELRLTVDKKTFQSILKTLAP